MHWYELCRVQGDHTWQRFDDRLRRTIVSHFILRSVGQKYLAKDLPTCPAVDNRQTVVCQPGLCRIWFAEYTRQTVW